MDKVTLGVLANHARAAAENMAYTLYRTAHSIVVKETEDFTVQILDAATFEVLADVPYEGFTRLNPIGDGRHLMVSATGGFHVLDAGAWSEPHGDHSHYYTGEARDTGVVYAAEKPGHVVNHGGKTTLFDDGTGHVVSFDTEHVAQQVHGVDEHVRGFGGHREQVGCVDGMREADGNLGRRGVVAADVGLLDDGDLVDPLATAGGDNREQVDQARVDP